MKKLIRLIKKLFDNKIKTKKIKAKLQEHEKKIELTKRKKTELIIVENYVSKEKKTEKNPFIEQRKILTDKLFKTIKDKKLELENLNKLFKEIEDVSEKFYDNPNFSVELEHETNLSEHLLTKQYFEVHIFRIYNINLIKKGNELIYLYLHTPQKHKDIEYINKELVKKYGITAKELEETKKVFKKIIFGYKCGFIASTPEKYKEMIKLVNEKNYNKLSNWLFSSIPELSAYGYTGLYFLSKKGEKINDLEEIVMENIKNSSIQINYCSGCTHYKISMREALKDSILDIYYDNCYKHNDCYGNKIIIIK